MPEAAGEEHAAPVELRALARIGMRRADLTARPATYNRRPSPSVARNGRGPVIAAPLPHHRGGSSMTPDDTASGMAKPELTREQIERRGKLVRQPLPARARPGQQAAEDRHDRPGSDAPVGEEMVLDGLPMRNLATFVTTWMEPEATRLIDEALHTNFIDHAEYPQTAEIEQRCIRMLADLFNAPGETTGARTQGSSEAIMLGALSLKWKWRARREAAGKSDRPSQPGVRRRRARRVGEVLPLLRRRTADRPAGARQVHDRPRGRRAARRREHDRRRRRARHDLHRACR